MAKVHFNLGSKKYIMEFLLDIILSILYNVKYKE